MIFEMLDKILDDETYRNTLSNKAIQRSIELSNNDGKMLQILNQNLLS